MNRMSLHLFLATMVATGAAVAQTPPTSAQATPPSSQQTQNANPGAKATAKASKSSAQQQESHNVTAATAESNGQATVTKMRPDARYAHPSGQDSRPDNASHSTKLAAAGSKNDTGSVTNRGTDNQTNTVKHLDKQGAYTGKSGSKQDAGTVCSTARPTADGGVDCGTSGDSATLGKVVTKPR